MGYLPNMPDFSVDTKLQTAIDGLAEGTSFRQYALTIQQWERREIEKYEHAERAAKSCRLAPLHKLIH